MAEQSNTQVPLDTPTSEVQVTTTEMQPTVDITTPVKTTQNTYDVSAITQSKSSPVMAESDTTPPVSRSSSSPSGVASGDATQSGYIAGAFESLDSLYRTTKQLVLEKIGKAKLSTDPQIQTKLDNMQEVKAQYEELTRLGNKYVEQFLALTETMDELGLRMISMAVKEKDAANLKKVGEGYRNLSKNNETYVSSVQTFYSSVEHFKDKALEDTLETAKKFDQVRFEYDIALEKYQQIEEIEKKNTMPSSRLASAKQELEKAQEKYETTRQALDIKIETLNFKRRGDMEYQMAAYLRNMTAYYSNSLYLLNKVSAVPIVKEETEVMPAAVVAKEEEKVEEVTTSNKEENVNNENTLI